ncbi:hypothetical protein ACFSSC_01925 [Corynebacterium mendelii]|uniref:Uncharacterized protein n=1 Tax=Corynebacterium mendelii TaxID=2765362 RepID=A0A939E064_9CORY|nr:hypothetical protein [Corynebacterium mendelii]MBN9644040.1 hypothetical protein [Corynebacterium mendelii]
MFTLDFDPAQQHRAAAGFAAAAEEELNLHQSERPNLPAGALGQEYSHTSARVSQLLEMIHDDTCRKYDLLAAAGRTFGRQVDAHVNQDRLNADGYRTDTTR